MLEPIAEFFSMIIEYIYMVIPNFGVAIIILTVLVKLVTFPLNNKQIQSSKRMQQLQPEMKRIQNKYKDDKEKQNKAMQEFMKENNMNPLAGCLPLLVQFPILIGIFRLLRDPEMIVQRIGEDFSPYLFPAQEAIDLLKLPMSTLSFESFISEISVYYIFPLIAGATTFVYSQMSTPGDSSQKMLLYMMPVMITVFSFSFPVGLVIYWIVNNLFSIGQHKVIVKLDEKKGEVKKESGEKHTASKNMKSKHDIDRGLEAQENITREKSQRNKRSKDRETDFLTLNSSEKNNDLNAGKGKGRD